MYSTIFPFIWSVGVPSLALLWMPFMLVTPPNCKKPTPVSPSPLLPFEFLRRTFAMRQGIDSLAD
jgi:hypothetical protein